MGQANTGNLGYHTRMETTNRKAEMTTTQRLIKSLEGMYYRRDKGLNTGRNAASTDATMDARWRQLTQALEAGGYEELDASDALARRFNRLERRRVGAQA